MAHKNLILISLYICWGFYTSALSIADTMDFSHKTIRNTLQTVPNIDKYTYYDTIVFKLQKQSGSRLSNDTLFIRNAFGSKNTMELKWCCGQSDKTIELRLCDGNDLKVISKVCLTTHYRFQLDNSKVLNGNDIEEKGGEIKGGEYLYILWTGKEGTTGEKIEGLPSHRLYHWNDTLLVKFDTLLYLEGNLRNIGQNRYVYKEIESGKECWLLQFFKKHMIIIIIILTIAASAIVAIIRLTKKNKKSSLKGHQYQSEDKSSREKEGKKEFLSFFEKKKKNKHEGKTEGTSTQEKPVNNGQATQTQERNEAHEVKDSEQGAAEGHQQDDGSVVERESESAKNNDNSAKEEILKKQEDNNIQEENKKLKEEVNILNKKLSETEKQKAEIEKLKQEKDTFVLALKEVLPKMAQKTIDDWVEKAKVMKLFNAFVGEQIESKSKIDKIWNSLSGENKTSELLSQLEDEIGKTRIPVSNNSDIVQLKETQRQLIDNNNQLQATINDLKKELESLEEKENDQAPTISIPISKESNIQNKQSGGVKDNEETETNNFNDKKAANETSSHTAEEEIKKLKNQLTEADKKVREYSEAKDKADKDLKEAKEKANKDLKEVKDNADKDLKEAKDKADKDLKEAKEKANKDLKEAKDKADKVLKETKDKADKVLKETKDKADKDLKEAKDIIEKKNNEIAFMNEVMKSNASVYINRVGSLLSSLQDELEQSLSDVSEKSLLQDLIKKQIIENKTLPLKRTLGQISLLKDGSINNLEEAQQKIAKIMKNMLEETYPTWFDVAVRLYAYSQSAFVAKQLTEKNMVLSKVGAAVAPIMSGMKELGITTIMPNLFKDRFDTDEHELQPVKDITQYIEGINTQVSTADTIVDIYMVGYKDGEQILKKASVATYQ